MIPFSLTEAFKNEDGVKLIYPVGTDVQQSAGANLLIDKVSTDSRACLTGALFIALKGERFDGHDYAASAADKGAKAVGVNQDWAEAHPEQLKQILAQNVIVISCPDTLRLLGLCGLAVREQFHGKAAALSGSCGKTTVKEMCAAILEECGRVLYTQGNYNNDIGVPLTLLGLESSHDFAVIEQGASHLKDLERTCEFVRSDAALINNVGQAHIEGFGSAEGVYIGKSELIVDAFARGKVGIVPSDSPWFERWCTDFARQKAEGRLLTFGSHDFDFVKVSKIAKAEGGISFTLTHQGQSEHFKLAMLGLHNAYNAAAAAALALAVGADFKAVCQGLVKSRNMQGRLRLIEMGSVSLIDDAYNASFDAVLAGINTLASFKNSFKVLVFGDMGELGSAKESLHQQVGEAAVGKVDAMFCIGSLSERSCSAFAGSRHFAAHDELNQALAALIDEKTASGQKVVVLVKGSHSMQMGKVNDFLLQRYY